ncbi:spermatid nuclear transition protein 3-like [Bubalus kerabau]|uniref:spermatid nuclear transition protein 3-like n=1 Tax=Bubalus carabanensis TaxID=3119969 RepID=UPI00244EA647|nr:spermatid nuclear transition protein 3-like [Bubalus carabanensis]XP_055420739.1 spermatid nuclear transition protein 3-like [Bubalus carabanensis]XP_055420788.1 spermatid nuclear transition protein 3-like [Bubalus carabanensis]
MTKGIRKPLQSRRVTMRFASRMNGQKKSLCQRRYRGSVKARNMTMRVRRPLQGTLRKKIRPYATQSKKVKKTRKPNCFLRSCARKKLNQSRKRYQNMRRDQRRRQNPKRR